jgi:hypothetical protein
MSHHVSGGRKKRKHPRFHSRAQAYIPNIIDEGGVLKDIGLTGCCLICRQKTVDIKLHEMYIIHVLPENGRHEKFELLAESRWVRDRGESCEIGFSIISSPFMFSQYKQRCRKIP